MPTINLTAGEARIVRAVFEHAEFDADWAAITQALGMKTHRSAKDSWVRILKRAGEAINPPIASAAPTTPAPAAAAPAAAPRASKRKRKATAAAPVAAPKVKKAKKGKKVKAKKAINDDPDA